MKEKIVTENGWFFSFQQLGLFCSFYLNGRKTIFAALQFQKNCLNKFKTFQLNTPFSLVVVSSMSTLPQMPILSWQGILFLCIHQGSMISCPQPWALALQYSSVTKVPSYVIPIISDP